MKKKIITKEFIVVILPIILSIPFICLHQICLFAAKLALGKVAKLHKINTFKFFIKEYNPKAIFEFGTYEGLVTAKMAEFSAPDTKIYTIELPNEVVKTALPISQSNQEMINQKMKTKVGMLFKKKKEKIIQLWGDTATFDFSPYFNKIDLIFIDGAHDYNYVMNDSEIAFKMLRNGKGIIVWHDYWEKEPGSLKAINELSQKYPGMTHLRGTNLVYLNTIKNRAFSFSKGAHE